MLSQVVHNNRMDVLFLNLANYACERYVFVIRGLPRATELKIGNTFSEFPVLWDETVEKR